MNHNMIGDLILNDALELYGQPKWTFGKNTCNTYEVFVEKVHMPDGDVIPAWPVVELIERDEALTLLFSRWFLENAMRSACDLTEQTDSNVTLSMNLLPLYADRESFVDDVAAMLKKNGLKPQKMQFEVSEAQDLTERGIANLNALHDEHGIGLWLANFGTGHSNVDLLREVHFDWSWTNPMGRSCPDMSRPAAWWWRSCTWRIRWTCMCAPRASKTRSSSSFLRSWAASRDRASSSASPWTWPA